MRSRLPWPWLAFAALLVAAPLVFSSSLALTILTQIGIAIVALLAYNVLLGQGGMLSFGHAVYSGLGAYAAIHALRVIGDGTLALPVASVAFVPLVGGLAGGLTAALLGFVTTRKAGTPFAMITLGIGELVWAVSLMFPAVFGGEAGISADRVVGPLLLGLSFGPAIELYALVAVYTFACTALLYGFTRTPLGRILEAVRDNPERVEFLGYRTQTVRWLAFIVSGTFMGIAGGLGALAFEIVTTEVLGALRSGSYLLFAVLGGTSHFAGPIVGAVLMVLSTVWLSALTPAWLLYLGLVFVGMLMVAPGGVAGLVLQHLQLARGGRLQALAGPYAALLLAAAVALAGLGALVEMSYRRQLDAALGSQLPYLGLTLDTALAGHWLTAAAVTLAGLSACVPAWRRFVPRWQQALTTGRIGGRAA